MIRRTGQFILGGILCGVTFLGFGGRLVMRGLALAIGRQTNFSLEATSGVVLIGAVLGMVGGVVFALMSKWLPNSSPIKGLLFGTLFLAVLIPLQPAAVQDEIEAFRGHLPLATACFWLVFAGYGIALEEIMARWDARGRSGMPVGDPGKRY